MDMIIAYLKVAEYFLVVVMSLEKFCHGLIFDTDRCHRSTGVFVLSLAARGQRCRLHTG